MDTVCVLSQVLKPRSHNGNSKIFILKIKIMQKKAVTKGLYKCNNKILKAGSQGKACQSTDCWILPLSFWFKKQELRIYPSQWVTRWCWGCWPREHTLRTTDLVYIHPTSHLHPAPQENNYFYAMSRNEKSSHALPSRSTFEHLTSTSALCLTEWCSLQGLHILIPQT